MIEHKKRSLKTFLSIKNAHKKLFELASDAGAIYRIDGTVLINRDIFDAYLERFHEPATGKGKEEMADER